MGMEFAPTWLRRVSGDPPPPPPLLHKTTLTTGGVVPKRSILVGSIHIFVYTPFDAELPTFLLDNKQEEGLFSVHTYVTEVTHLTFNIMWCRDVYVSWGLSGFLSQKSSRTW